MTGDDHEGDARGTDGDRLGRSAVPEAVTIALIAAVAANGVIGRDGAIPWHHPEDLRRFKRLTTGHPVIMGRRTYESIVAGLGEPLPGRTSVVLSRSALTLPAGAVGADSLQAALDLAVADARERGVATVYVAGGETVYEQWLPLADRLVLTELDAAHDGDTHFPSVDWTRWRETDREDHEALAFVTYERD